MLSLRRASLGGFAVSCVLGLGLAYHWNSPTDGFQHLEAVAPMLVEYGDEFWLEAQPMGFESARTRVSHAFRSIGSKDRATSTGEHHVLSASSDSLEFRAKDGSTRLEWRTAGLSFGGSRLTLRAGAARWVGDVWQRPLVADSLGLVEHIQSVRDGAHYSWILPRRPAGGGDLVLHTRFSGVSFDGRSTSGLRLVGIGGERFRVSQASLVDSAGKRTPLAMQVDGPESVAILVPAAALADAEYPISIDPVIEVELDPGAVVGVDDRRDWRMTHAANGDGQTLVVWTDRTQFPYRIFGARVSDSGDVLDSPPIAISKSTEDCLYPSVASDGANFLVTWQDNRNGVLDIYGVRLDADGSRLDASDLEIDAGSTAAHFSQVAYAGGNYAVSYQDQSVHTGRYTVHAKIISPTGAIGSKLTLYGSTESIRKNFLASDGSNFISLYSSRSWTRGRHFGVGGTIGPEFDVGTGDHDAPRMSWDGTRWHITYHNRSDTYTYMRQYSPTGGVSKGWILGPGGANSDSSDWPRATASTVDETLVFFTRIDVTPFQLEMVRCAPECANTSGWTPTGPTSVISTGSEDARFPTATVTSAGYLVTWREGSGTSFRIRGQRFAVGGTKVGPEFTVARFQNRETHSAVVASDSQYLLVWADDRSGDWDVLATRISETGAILDPSGLEVLHGPGDQSEPSVASDGTSFLVVAEDGSAGTANVQGALVSADGTVDVTSPGVLAGTTNDETGPVVQSNGSGYFVSWSENGDVKGRAVTATGTSIPTIALAVSTDDERNPDVASDGSDYLVVFESSGDVRGVRVSGSGGSLDSSPGFAISSGAAIESRPSVAGTTTGYYVVWQDERGANASAYGTRIDSQGRVQDSSGVLLSAPSVSAYAPATAGGNGTFYVVWESDDGGGPTNLYGTTVEGDGTGSTSGGEPISSAASSHSLLPACADGIGDAFVVSYASVAVGNEGSTGQVRVRVVSLDPDGDGVSRFQGDCDDDEATVFPGAHESCDSVDSNCDGSLVDGYFDNDEDGIPDCVDPDDDNDGQADDLDPCPFIATVTSCSEDSDGDGVSDGNETLLARNDPNTAPGFVEICDGRDNDGDSLIDEGTGCNTCD